jgi:PAS domain S-box-containing protein
MIFLPSKGPSKMGELNSQEFERGRMSKSDLIERLNTLHRAPHELSGKFRETEMLAVLHELEVYQIELEMQNRELRESRQALEESHENYINLYDFAPVGFLTFDEQGLMKDVNLSAAGMLGVERRWLIGRSFTPWIKGGDIAAFRTHIKQCLRIEERVTTVLQLLSKDKRSIPVELSSTVSTDIATGARVIRSAVIDLSARREAEEERDRFFELSTEFLCSIGADGRFRRFNPTWTKELGCGVGELLSRPFLDFVHSSDRKEAESEMQKILNGKAAKSEFRTRLIREDRSLVWVAWTAVASGASIYVVGRDVSREVVEKEAIENRYAWLQEMVRAMPVAMVLTEAVSGKVVTLSAEAKAFYGKIPRVPAELSYDGSLYFMDSTGARLNTESWPRLRAARGEILNGEQFIWHTPDRDTHLLVWSRVIPSQYGQPEMVLLLLQNIDALKEKEASLVEAVDKLNTERKLREEFVSSLSHDLRTPLTAAKLGLQILAHKSADSSDVRHRTTGVVKHLERINHMIEDLLDANRIHAGENLPMMRSQVDLVLLARSTLDDLAEVHGPRFVLEGVAGAVGNWSRHHIRRVLENLANNAVKYGCPTGAITVSVTTLLDSRVLLSVHNFGNPIPAEEQHLLFEQFQRTTSARRSGLSGWGLGLALARGIVEAHGGEVRVESTPESGTKFSVLLLP